MLCNEMKYWNVIDYQKHKLYILKQKYIYYICEQIRKTYKSILPVETPDRQSFDIFI